MHDLMHLVAEALKELTSVSRPEWETCVDVRPVPFEA